MLSAVKVQSSNHWIAKEFPYGRIFKTSIEDYTGLTYFEERKWSLKAEGKLQGLKYEASCIRTDPQVVPKAIGRCYNMKSFMPHGKEFALLTCGERGISL